MSKEAAAVADDAVVDGEERPDFPSLDTDALAQRAQEDTPAETAPTVDATAGDTSAATDDAGTGGETRVQQRDDGKWVIDGKYVGDTIEAAAIAQADAYKEAQRKITELTQPREQEIEPEQDELFDAPGGFDAQRPMTALERLQAQRVIRNWVREDPQLYGRQAAVAALEMNDRPLYQEVLREWAAYDQPGASQLQMEVNYAEQQLQQQMQAQAAYYQQQQQYDAQRQQTEQATQAFTQAATAFADAHPDYQQHEQQILQVLAEPRGQRMWKAAIASNDPAEITDTLSYAYEQVTNDAARQVVQQNQNQQITQSKVDAQVEGGGASDVDVKVTGRASEAETQPHKDAVLNMIGMRQR